MMKKVILAVTVSALLAGCAEQGGMYSGSANGGADPIFNKRNAGGLAGAVGGALLGRTVGKGSGKTAAIAIGTLLGAGLGASIGQSLDAADLNIHEQTSQRALERATPGQSLPWTNPETGNSGTITPNNYYKTASGQYCREYTQTINVGGRTEEGVGTACRQPDGSWKIVQQFSYLRL